MTLVGRDRPKGYERGLDNAAISANLRIQKGRRAVHLGTVGLVAGRHDVEGLGDDFTDHWEFPAAPGGGPVLWFDDHLDLRLVIGQRGLLFTTVPLAIRDACYLAIAYCRG
jgi:hypothetical protein